ncbi:hypothetical protein M8J77_024468 [Diaphorina citri]|nr:hypothetical protein M8J77_024468 [Diaphorina citri]
MAAEEKRPVRTRGVNPAPNRTRGLAARKLRGVPRHGTVLGSETDRRLRTTRTPDTRRRPGARAHESRAATGLHLAQARLYDLARDFAWPSPGFSRSEGEAPDTAATAVLSAFGSLSPC